MNIKQPAAPATHLCPTCHQPQTKIQRVLGEGRLGAVSYVCSRPPCARCLDLSKVETWVAV
jgi:hypothetical protein